MVFDDKFSTVSYMEKGTVPPNWADLVQHSSELTTNQDYNLAETWLEQSNSVSDLPPADSPVVNPFAIVSDQHRNSTKRGTINQSISTLESVEATTTKPTTLADSEGDHSPPSNKQRRVTAVTTDANSRMDQVRVEISNDFT